MFVIVLLVIHITENSIKIFEYRIAAATSFLFRIAAATWFLFWLHLLQMLSFTFCIEVGIAHFMPHKCLCFSRKLKPFNQNAILRVPKFSLCTSGLPDSCESMFTCLPNITGCMYFAEYANTAVIYRLQASYWIHHSLQIEETDKRLTLNVFWQQLASYEWLSVSKPSKKQQHSICNFPQYIP